MTSVPSATEIRVLHLVGGRLFEGGTASVVRDLVEAGSLKIKCWIWMHRDCPEQILPIIRKGSVEIANKNIVADAMGALRELPLLIRTIKQYKISVLHAHTRLGIFSGWLAHHFSGLPLFVHLHFLARRPWVYRFLIRTTKAAVIYNSRRTAEHYGADPEHSHIIMPTLEWPVACPPASKTSRVVAASALYPNKHLDAVIAACTLLANAGNKIDALICGRTLGCRGGAYEQQVISICGDKLLVKLEDWDRSWTEKLRDQDVFVHLGRPESFGLVILEAFARGLRLVVLPGTFLDDLPGETSKTGIYRAETLSPKDVANAIEQVLSDPINTSELHRFRMGVAPRFSKEGAAKEVGRMYSSAPNNLDTLSSPTSGNT